MQEKTVLVIDDSNTSVLLMDYALKHAGFKTQLAYNVKEAFEQIKINEPQLIILDLSMPEISGYDFLRMKKDMKLDHIPVFVISAHDTASSIQKSMELGANEFIPKPVKIEIIIEKVKAILNK